LQYLLLFLDNENLLVTAHELCNIQVEFKQNAVLPCRPTSPDFKIILSKDGRIVSSSK